MIYWNIYHNSIKVSNLFAIRFIAHTYIEYRLSGIIVIIIIFCREYNDGGWKLLHQHHLHLRRIFGNIEKNKNNSLMQIIDIFCCCHTGHLCSQAVFEQQPFFNSLLLLHIQFFSQFTHLTHFSCYSSSHIFINHSCH